MSLLALLVLGPVLGCKKKPPHTTVAVVDSGPRFSVPSVLPAVGTRSAREFDVPLAWLYLVEEPVPTGSAPDVIVGAEVPCGFVPLLGTVSPPETPLRVRLRVRFAGPGEPDATIPCPTRPGIAVPISLQRLRRASFTVTDEMPHGAGDPPMPSVSLHVIEDNERTPAPMLRRVRPCNPDDDASCTGGGACGGVPGRPGVGVCAPPLDPYLSIGRSCPAGSAEIRLERARPFGVRAAPPPGEFRACLPSCDPAHPCTAPLSCLQVGGHGVCAPQS